MMPSALTVVGLPDRAGGTGPGSESAAVRHGERTAPWPGPPDTGREGQELYSLALLACAFSSASSAASGCLSRAGSRTATTTAVTAARPAQISDTVDMPATKASRAEVRREEAGGRGRELLRDLECTGHVAVPDRLLCGLRQTWLECRRRTRCGRRSSTTLPEQYRDTH